MTNKKIVVIGGSAAGPKAAARARRLDQNAEITIIQKDSELSMASCGYPYYVGGFFDDRDQLLCTPTGVVRDPLFFLNTKDIIARTRTEATAIERKDHKVICKNLDTGETEDIKYDKLIIATGSTPRIPPIPGKDLDGITTLQSMQDADFLHKICADKEVKKAVIIGGGLIGIETSEALQLEGIEVTIIELLPQILMFLDWELAKIVENHASTKISQIITDNAVVKFVGRDGKLTGVALQDGTETDCQLAVVAIGVQPNSGIAKEAGLSIGSLGGIDVNEHMLTSDPDIYAAGDCVEVRNIITGKKTLAPMGDLANLQGRVAGENAVLGNSTTFPGTIQTGICKVFEYSAGSTGLSESNALRHGYQDIITVTNAGLDKPGFMDGRLLITKMVAQKETGKILGVQCVGPGDVSKQISQAAIAIQGNFTLSDLVNSDLPYAPPFASAIDNLVVTAHILENKIKGRLNGISVVDVKKKLDNHESPFLLDMRAPDEFEVMRLGVGETLLPLGALRNRLNELPQDKGREIICYCKISLRGYEASLILKANGWKNVKVMEGGIMAWPYAREK